MKRLLLNQPYLMRWILVTFYCLKLSIVDLLERWQWRTQISNSKESIWILWGTQKQRPSYDRETTQKLQFLWIGTSVRRAAYKYWTIEDFWYHNGSKLSRYSPPMLNLACAHIASMMKGNLRDDLESFFICFQREKSWWNGMDAQYKQ